MKTTITITQTSNGKKLTLSENQTRLVQVEMRRIRSFWAYYKNNQPGAAASITMEIEEKQKTKHFSILNQNVLLDTQKRKVYQFYMGLQLLEWLKTS